MEQPVLEQVAPEHLLLGLTKQKEYAQALREERDRFETLFENLPTPVVRCMAGEGETFLVDANTAFEGVFGMDVSTVEGKDVNELLVPEGSLEEAIEIDEEEGPQKQEVRREVKGGSRDFSSRLP